MVCPLSPAHFVALGAFQLYVLLLFFDISLAPLPLVIFIFICIVAPLFPGFSFYLPVISRGRRDETGVALTFDDGPDPAVTPRLLDLLEKHNISATFFVTGVNAGRYPELVRAILSRGHAVGNHTYNHSPFVMLKGGRTLRREVASAQKLLREFGVVPLAFRPPVGITSPLLWRVLLDQGMFCVNFSRRAGDRGNRRVVGLAAKMLKRVVPGDIILLHDVTPRQGDVGHLLGEFEALIAGLKATGREILPLARLIGKEVMLRSETASVANPAELFYNGLAATYDHEQFCSTVAISRQHEYKLFTARLDELFAGADRVLEIGAGTGIFTLAIAGQCREVLAVDISANMLGVLEQKARAEGVTNIRPLLGDVEKIELDGTFSAVCAFLSLEYISDLPLLLRRLSSRMEPGGAIYFTIARRSMFRFFTQIGNAMRQGIWLRAYSRREIEAMLRAAGFESVEVTAHLLKSWISGGMLLEVVARKARHRPDTSPDHEERD